MSKDDIMYAAMAIKLDSRGRRLLLAVRDGAFYQSLSQIVGRELTDAEFALAKSTYSALLVRVGM